MLSIVYAILGNSILGGKCNLSLFVDVSKNKKQRDNCYYHPSYTNKNTWESSYFSNFIGKREYQGRSINQQMGEPYKRIVIMHVTIIIGGFLAMALNSTMPVLLLLIAIKLTSDIRSHVKEHQSTPTPASA